MKNTNDVYRGPDVELRDEINTRMTGGKVTSQLAITSSQMLGLSPARTQAMADSYLARNPISWLIGETFESETTMQQSVLEQLSKTAGSRQFIGQTRPGWAAMERGQAAIERGGSVRNAAIYQKIDEAILMYRAGDMSESAYKQHINRVAKETDVLKFKADIIALGYGEINAKRKVYDRLISKHGANVIYSELPPARFWGVVNRIASPADKAEHLYTEYLNTDKKFRRDFETLAHIYRVLSDPSTAVEWRKLKRIGVEL